MTMYEYATQEMHKIERQMANDNRKLDALRLLIKEYVTEDFPNNAKLNLIISECLRKHEGHATFQHIADCIEEHQIIIPRNKLSLLLTNNKTIEYDKNAKEWRILTNV